MWSTAFNKTCKFTRHEKQILQVLLQIAVRKQSGKKLMIERILMDLNAQMLSLLIASGDTMGVIIWGVEVVDSVLQ